MRQARSVFQGSGRSRFEHSPLNQPANCEQLGSFGRRYVKMNRGEPRGVRGCSAIDRERLSDMAENLVDIGEVIVHGVLFDPKNSELVRAMDLNELYSSASRLFTLCDERGIEYVLVGGIAMLTYVDGRNTQDIDLIISRNDLAKLPEIHIDDQNSEFARGMYGDLRIDFLFTDSKLFDLVRQQHATTRRFLNRDVPCATVEGLLLLKLFALPSLYRQAQFSKVNIYEADAANLIARDKMSMQPILDELATHMLASDLAEVRRIVAEIEDRIARQAHRFGDGQ